MRSEFEKTRTFKSIYSTLMYFDENLNIYASNNKLRDEDAVRLTYAWWGYQEHKNDELKKQLIDQGQRFNDQAQRVKDLEYWNGELQKRIDDALEKIDRFYKDGCLFHEWVIQAEKALKGRE